MLELDIVETMQYYNLSEQFLKQLKNPRTITHPGSLENALGWADRTMIDAYLLAYPLVEPKEYKDETMKGYFTIALRTLEGNVQSFNKFEAIACAKMLEIRGKQSFASDNLSRGIMSIVGYYASAFMPRAKGAFFRAGIQTEELLHRINKNEKYEGFPKHLFRDLPPDAQAIIAKEFLLAPETNQYYQAQQVELLKRIQNKIDLRDIESTVNLVSNYQQLSAIQKLLAKGLDSLGNGQAINTSILLEDNDQIKAYCEALTAFNVGLKSDVKDVKNLLLEQKQIREAQAEVLLIQKNLSMFVNACNAVQALTGGNEKIAKFTTASSALAQMYAGYKLLKDPVLAANAAVMGVDPMTLVVSAFVTIASMLFSDDQENEMWEAIQEHFRMLSQQMQQMREEMHESFALLFESQRRILQAIYEGFSHIDQLIRNEFTKLHVPLFSTLSDIQIKLDLVLKMVNEGHKQQSLNELGKIIHAAKKYCEGFGFDRTPKLISMNIEFLRWITAGEHRAPASAAPMLSGSIHLNRHDGEQKDPAACANEVIASPLDSKCVFNLLGYLAHYPEKNLGIKWTTFNPSNVVNPEIWGLALHSYSEFRSHFKDKIKDPKNQSLEDIHSLIENQFESIKAVQQCPLLFTTLFEKSNERIQQIAQLMEEAIQDKNMKLQAKIKNSDSKEIKVNIEDTQLTLENFKEIPAMEKSIRYIPVHCMDKDNTYKEILNIGPFTNADKSKKYPAPSEWRFLDGLLGHINPQVFIEPEKHNFWQLTFTMDNGKVYQFQSPIKNLSQISDKVHSKVFAQIAAPALYSRELIAQLKTSKPTTISRNEIRYVLQIPTIDRMRVTKAEIRYEVNQEGFKIKNYTDEDRKEITDHLEKYFNSQKIEALNTEPYKTMIAKEFTSLEGNIKLLMAYAFIAGFQPADIKRLEEIYVAFLNFKKYCSVPVGSRSEQIEKIKTQFNEVQKSIALIFENKEYKFNSQLETQITVSSLHFIIEKLKNKLLVPQSSPDLHSNDSSHGPENKSLAKTKIQHSQTLDLFANRVASQLLNEKFSKDLITQRLKKYFLLLSNDMLKILPVHTSLSYVEENQLASSLSKELKNINDWNSEDSFEINDLISLWIESQKKMKGLNKPFESKEPEKAASGNKVPKASDSKASDKVPEDKEKKTPVIVEDVENFITYVRDNPFMKKLFPIDSTDGNVLLEKQTFYDSEHKNCTMNNDQRKAVFLYELWKRRKMPELEIKNVENNFLFFSNGIISFHEPVSTEGNLKNQFEEILKGIDLSKINDLPIYFCIFKRSGNVKTLGHYTTLGLVKTSESTFSLRYIDSLHNHHHEGDNELKVKLCKSLSEVLEKPIGEIKVDYVAQQDRFFHVNECGQHNILNTLSMLKNGIRADMKKMKVELGIPGNFQNGGLDREDALALISIYQKLCSQLKISFEEKRERYNQTRAQLEALLKCGIHKSKGSYESPQVTLVRRI